MMPSRPSDLWEDDVAAWEHLEALGYTHNKGGNQAPACPGGSESRDEGGDSLPLRRVGLGV